MKRGLNLGPTIAALLTSATLLGFGVLTFEHGTGAVKPVVLPFDTFWCAKNDDCKIVDRIGCCACSEGGAQGAVTKWHTDDLRLFLKSACRPRPVCVQLDLCRNDVKAICEDHACRLVPDHKKTPPKEDDGGALVPSAGAPVPPAPASAPSPSPAPDAPKP